MRLRFASGSVTPGELRQEALLRLRRARAAPRGGRGTSRRTCSASLSRSSPWSTKTHVSWSPTARCTSSAATAESTPPESAQMTCSSPTCSRMRATCSSMTCSAVHVGAAPGRPRTGSCAARPCRAACARPRGGTARRRCRARVLHRRDRRAGRRRRDAEAVGHAARRASLWLIQHGLVLRAGRRTAARSPSSSTAVLPNSARARAADLAAERAGHAPACRSRCPAPAPRARGWPGSRSGAPGS